MSILVIIEHDNNNFNKVILNTISAANLLGGNIDLLVIGFKFESVLEKLKKIPNIKKIIAVDNEVYKNFQVENIVEALKSLVINYEYILSASTTFGKNILPRLAAVLDYDVISDVIEIVNKNTFKRPIYAGNIIETIELNSKIKFLTVRATSFEAVKLLNNNSSVELEKINLVKDLKLSELISAEINNSERPELISAQKVVSGGRGLQSKDNFKLIEQLADKLNAAIGASRAAVDAGFISNDFQIGQTGKVVAPDLYVAIGISGAVQHVSGMKDSKIVVSINKDEDAPIIGNSDYYIIDDLFNIVPEILEKLD